MKKYLLLYAVFLSNLVANAQIVKRDIMNRIFESKPEAVCRIQFDESYFYILTWNNHGYSVTGKYPYYLSDKEENCFDQTKVGAETSGNYLIVLNSKLDTNRNKITFACPNKIKFVTGKSLSITIDDIAYEFSDKGVATSEDITKLAEYKEGELGFGEKTSIKDKRPIEQPKKNSKGKDKGYEPAYSYD